jgi:hypothetical protein
MSSAMTSLAGRYPLDCRIDTGGCAEVGRAKDTVLARPVAVKVLRPELAAGAQAHDEVSAVLVRDLHSIDE